MTIKQVAATIKQQIGIWPLAEVGARGFMYDSTSLYFDAKPTTRIVRVIVTLTPADLYDVRVANKKTGAELYSVEGVYGDMLAGIVRDLPKNMKKAS